MFGKKHPACGEHLAALERAKRGRRESEHALNEQETKASREDEDVIQPLRELRERNHFAEMIVASIAAGYDREE